MLGLPGATLVELPRKLHRTLATKRELHGRAADISESVVHSALMGLLLMTSEVTPRPPPPASCSAASSTPFLREGDLRTRFWDAAGVSPPPVPQPP